MWAGSVLAGLAAGLFAPGGRTLSAGKANAGGIDFAESSCSSKDKAGKKILVAYASRYSTTGGVAEAIGRTLCDAGFDVDSTAREACRGCGLSIAPSCSAAQYNGRRGSLTP